MGFSITDSDSTYEGWILEENGKLMARFSWPEGRSHRSVMVSSFQVIIKNGYLYSAERDIKAGIDRIVKYKIQIK